MPVDERAGNLILPHRKWALIGPTQTGPDVADWAPYIYLAGGAYREGGWYAVAPRSDQNTEENTVRYYMRNHGFRPIYFGLPPQGNENGTTSQSAPAQESNTVPSFGPIEDPF